MIIHNPIDNGDFADPEARFYDGQYWIYVTQSLDFPDQKNLSAFSSPDMVNWTRHDNIIDMSDYSWVWGAVWAPTIIDKDGKYYLIFATNNTRTDDEPGGLEIVVSDKPQGPFKTLNRKTLVPRWIKGAQPIDAHLFRDDDGKIYLYFGGCRHCIVCIMNDTMDGFVPFDDGETFKEITPPGYVEGPCMLKKDGEYYFMWSTGDWGTDNYGVIYARSKSPLGPFDKATQILKMDPAIAKGPGHHGYLNVRGTDDYVIVYHRRPLNQDNANCRKICIDKLIFDENGDILPVVMTNEAEI